jgi:N-methylhydantoinase A
MKAYIGEIEQLFRSLGYKKEIRYMQCNGGVASGEIIKQKPVLALNSGPSGSPAAGLFFGRLLGYDNLITIDMGGTSLDATIIHEGAIEEVKDIDICRYRVGISTVRVNSLGAGGGSIAWIDSGGILRVGPQSAEAIPGPACYDRGNTEPTVTDANVALGYFNPDFLLGGGLKIIGELSKKAVYEKIAQPLGLTMEQAAIGILKVVNANTTNGIREISLQRGLDTRDFVLFAAGGCGPAHAIKMASELRIPRVIIPNISSAFCAFGGAIADVRHDYTFTYASLFSELDLDRLNRLLEDTEARAYEDLALEGFTKNAVRIVRTFYIRYLGQFWDCPVVIPKYSITNERVSEIAEAFHQVHERLYTFADRNCECELVSVGIRAYGPRANLETAMLSKEGKNPSKAKKGERMAYFEKYSDYVKTSVYDGSQVRPGNVIEGPAVVEDVTTTIVVFPGSRLELDEHDVYIMTFHET